MDHEPQDRISQIPEISDSPWISGLRHFVAAWGWGLLSGISTIVVGMLLLDRGSPELEKLLMFTYFLGVFVGIFALGGMLLVGLPLTFLLSAIRKEHATIYALIGFVAGFLIIAAISDFPRYTNPKDLLFHAAGAFAGLASALRWGRWRQSRSAARHRPMPEKRTNPIHDLIH